MATQYLLASHRLPHPTTDRFVETVSTDDFKEAFRKHTAGVSIITAQGPAVR